VSVSLEAKASDAGDVTVDINFDPQLREPSNQDIAVLKQIEFYFSEGNLRRDVFLRDHMKEHGGWAQISTIADFGKVKQITPSVTEVATALCMSSLLEVDILRMMVRNNTGTELPEYMETLPRTVCVENIRIGTTIPDMEATMSQFKHPVSYVQIPQDAVNGRALGFAFVEYSSAEVAQEVVAAAAAQGSDARGAKSWRGAKDKVVCCMKADWEKRRKKGKNKERKQERKAKNQDVKQQARLASSPDEPALSNSLGRRDLGSPPLPPKSKNSPNLGPKKSPNLGPKKSPSLGPKKKSPSLGPKKSPYLGGQDGSKGGKGEGKGSRHRSDSRSPPLYPQGQEPPSDMMFTLDAPPATAAEAQERTMSGSGGAVSIADDEEWWKNRKQKKKYEPPVSSGEERPQRLKLKPRSRTSSVARAEDPMAKGPNHTNCGFAAGRGKRMPLPPMNASAPLFVPGSLSGSLDGGNMSGSMDISAPSFSPSGGVFGMSPSGMSL